MWKKDKLMIENIKHDCKCSHYKDLPQQAVDTLDHEAMKTICKYVRTSYI